MKDLLNFRIKIFLLLIGLLFTACSKDVEKPVEKIVGEISIIPLPNSVKRIGGQFEINEKTKIVAVNEAEIKMSELLNNVISKNYGFALETTNRTDQPNTIVFFTDSNFDKPELQEGYNLKIDSNQIQIKGLEKGLFYGLQSLLQLLPGKDNPLKIPAAEISDSPRFSYRGMHLDSARHFMPVEFIKKFLGVLAKYKFNRFHWHLTDDQGWRVEVKKYPKLTEIGSKRPETVVEKNYQPYKGDGIPVEGFYTQEQIREIVEFAEANYITVIPEIEMPGHSSAILAAYPEYGCKENYRYKVKTTWGAFPDILCPTEPTFKFIEDVLSEVNDLFPNSPFIHIGGDEIITDHWRDSPYVQSLKKRENLENEKKVHSWFIKRVENFVNSKGKKIIAWNEVLDEDITSDTVIMVWKDAKDGVTAAKRNHQVIMTPWERTYFDHPQAEPKSEPLSLGPQVPLEKVYQFEPVSGEIDARQAKQIIGGQGCLWTEFLKTTQDVEYMAFPRAIALAEVLWSKQTKKDYFDFLERLNRNLPQLDAENVNYRIPKPLGLPENFSVADNKILVDLKPIKNGKIYYTLDGSEPNAKSNFYQSPFMLELPENQTKELKVKVINSRQRESKVFSGKYFRPSKTEKFNNPADEPKKNPKQTGAFDSAR